MKILIKKILILIAILPLMISANTNQTHQSKPFDAFSHLNVFATTLAIVENCYESEVTVSNLVYEALEGMLHSLDKHSEFMDPQEGKSLQESTEGKFGGLGIEVDFRDDYPFVITPIEGTPAFTAGIISGDEIIKIDDVTTKGMTANESIKIMRGDAGSQVKLTIRRNIDGKSDILNFVIVRDIIKIKRVCNSKIIDSTNMIGYVRVTTFGVNTTKELVAEIDKLRNQNMQMLILDLRNNGGGLLMEAIAMSDLFLSPSNLIVSIKGRMASQNKVYYSSTELPKYTMPLVLLVNESSASASEIVCGALKDNNRGIVVGAKTFGKGSVQTIIPIPNSKYSLRLTTAKYYTPSGQCIHGTGIKPHVEVLVSDKDKFKIYEKRLAEKVGLDKQKSSAAKITKYNQLLKFKDAQLERAKNLLLAVKIYKKGYPNE